MRSRKREPFAQIPHELFHAPAEWRPVLGYEGLYSVDVDSGRVWSYRRKGRVLKHWTNTKGYQLVKLFKDGVARNRLIHVLVLDTILGSCPIGLETLHTDGDPANNTSSNLTRGTPMQNADDKYRHGTNLARGPIADAVVVEVRRLRQLGVTMRSIGGALGVSRATVADILRGKSYARVGV